MELVEAFDRIQVASKKMNKLIERTKKLPINLRVIFYEDVINAMEVRLEVMENEAKRRIQ